MTEDEAKTKWCPFSNVYVQFQSTGAAGNRGMSKDRDTQGNESQTRCLGSGCMAWRKDRSLCKNRRGQFVDRDIDGTGHWVDDGHCGLAGTVPL